MISLLMVKPCNQDPINMSCLCISTTPESRYFTNRNTQFCLKERDFIMGTQHFFSTGTIQ